MGIYVWGVGGRGGLSFSLSQAGRVFAAGFHADPTTTPTPAASLLFCPPLQVAAGNGVSAVIDANGQLFTWGRMTHSSMLAHGSSGPRFGVRQPTRVDALARQGVTVASASFGTQHAAAVVGIPRSL